MNYRRADHDSLHVRGYKREGTTTTPFDMVIAQRPRPLHLVMDVIDGVPGRAQAARGRLRRHLGDDRLRQRAYTRQVGDDSPEVRDWAWPGSPPPAEGAADVQRGQPA